MDEPEFSFDVNLIEHLRRITAEHEYGTHDHEYATRRHREGAFVLSMPEAIPQARGPAQYTAAAEWRSRRLLRIAREEAGLHGLEASAVPRDEDGAFAGLIPKESRFESHAR